MEWYWYGIYYQFDCLIVRRVGVTWASGAATTDATFITDFELARSGRPKFSKGRAMPAGYARMLATLASRARCARTGIAIPLFDCLGVWGKLFDYLLRSQYR